MIRFLPLLTWNVVFHSDHYLVLNLSPCMYIQYLPSYHNMLYSISICYILCAYDIQLRVFLLPNVPPGLNRSLSNCADDIKEWSISNNIILSASITIISNIFPSSIEVYYKYTYFHPFLIGNIVISPSLVAHKFGVILYSTLSFIH